MKATKKLLAMMLSMIMVLAMAAPAFAEEEETSSPASITSTYTITAPSNDHTYEVYQIFTGDYADGILSNVKWGENGTGTEGEAVSADIITELTGTTGTDTAKLAVISKYVNLKSDEFGTVKGGSSLNVPGGYYLIKDVDGALEGEEDAYTLYVVEVVGDVTIEPKSDVPESEKKVKDTNDTDGTTTDWQDSADWDIGDKVPFQLKGTVADDYDNYKVYQFIFHDQESSGLTFDSSSVKVYVDGKEITTGFEVKTSGFDEDDDCTFEVVFEDLKKIDSVHAGSVITVEYESELNSNAVLGSAGNPNKMHLEFSNNPNDEQGGETGETPDDTVIVFTYKTVINKKLPAGEGEQGNQPLAGAEFTLEKKVKDDEAEGGYKWVAINVVKSNEDTTFTFSGLDDGDYRLTETKTPDGYNTIDPIEFTVTATHDITSDNPALTELNGNKVTGEITFTSNTGDGSLTADVVNQSGATLPETGGIGTTIFYIVGGILVVTAGILLITKKRMNINEEK